MIVAVAPATGQVGALDVQVQQTRDSVPSTPQRTTSPTPCRCGAVGEFDQPGRWPPRGASVQTVGTGFVQGRDQVYFGTRLATSVTVSSGTSLSAQVPSGQGVVDAQALVNGEISAVNLPADMFTYSGSNPPPTVAAVLPGSGPWNTAAIIVGTGFLPGTSVTFLGQTSPTIVGLSTTELVAVAPSGISVGTTVGAPASQRERNQQPKPSLRPVHIRDARRRHGNRPFSFPRSSGNERDSLRDELLLNGLCSLRCLRLAVGDGAELPGLNCGGRNRRRHGRCDRHRLRNDEFHELGRPVHVHRDARESLAAILEPATDLS